MSKKTSYRAVFLRFLIVLVTVAGRLAMNEVDREHRREKLVADLADQGATWRLFDPESDGRGSDAPPTLWRESMGAWLRGRPIVPHRRWAVLPKGISPEQTLDFVDLFPTIRSLEIDGDVATPQVLDALASCGSLERFKIDNPLTVDDDTARRLARIKCADGIALTNQQCTDAALLNLAAAGVRIEEYSGPDHWKNVGDDGLKTTAKFPDNLYVWANCRGTDEGINALAGHPMLSVLRLNGPNYGDASAETISKLPRLIQLHIAATSHTDAGLAKLIDGCGASYIELKKVAVGDRTIAALRKAPELITLRLADVDLTLEQCDELAKLSISLNLKSDTLTDEHIARLAPMAPSMVAFTLDAPKVTDDGLAWLKGAKKLVSLHLDNTGATSATWKLLPHPKAMRAIGMGGPNLDVTTMLVMLRFTNGEAFRLTGGNVDDVLLQGVPTWFKVVDLNNTRVTMSGVAEFAARTKVAGINLSYDASTPRLIDEDDLKFVKSIVDRQFRLSLEVSPSPECD